MARCGVGGGNYAGGLGDGSTTDRLTPVRVSGLTGVVAVAADSGGVVCCGANSLAVKSDGSVWAWGGNIEGQLGDGTSIDRYSPVQVSGLTGAVAVAGGCYFSLALKSDGTVWGWGANWDGQTGTTTPPSEQGAKVLVLSPAQVSGLTDVIAISAGSEWGMALKVDGTVWAWGKNRKGQLGDGTSIDRYSPVQVKELSDPTGYLSGVLGISGGDGAHSLAVKSDGTVWAWGSNPDGGLGDGSTTARLTPVRVSGLTGVVAVEAGSDYSLALKSDGTVWAWGGNRRGQLGDGTTLSRLTPAQISGLSGVIALEVGYFHNMAIVGPP